LREAKIEIEKLEQSSRMNLTQSARDMMLSLRVEIQNMLKKIIDEKVSESLTPESVASIIRQMAEHVVSQEDKAQTIEVFVSPEDLKKLQQGFISQMQNRLKKDIKLQASEDVSKGFLISFDAGKSSFDFTDESLARYLSVYLNAQLNSLLDQAIKK